MIGTMLGIAVWMMYEKMEVVTVLKENVLMISILLFITTSNMLLLHQNKKLVEAITTLNVKRRRRASSSDSIPNTRLTTDDMNARLM